MMDDKVPLVKHFNPNTQNAFNVMFSDRLKEDYLVISFLLRLPTCHQCQPFNINV